MLLEYIPRDVMVTAAEMNGFCFVLLYLFN